MSDPAVEAAHRAALQEPYGNTRQYDMIAAARQALKPIRDHIAAIPAGLDSTALYDELTVIFELAGGHCDECQPRRHKGHCYPKCGCPDSEAFDWEGFADDINGGDVGV